MAELADALDLGSSAVKGVQVQVLFPAPAFEVLRCAQDFGSGLRRPLNASSSSPVPGTSVVRDFRLLQVPSERVP